MKKEIPILMTTLMVQALLEGRKTKTRRIVKDQDKYAGHLTDEEMEDMSVTYDVYRSEDDGKMYGPAWIMLEEGLVEWVIGKCPYGEPGDVLWVRECIGLVDANPFNFYPCIYRADYADDITKEQLAIRKWKPSIHMRKEAARIWLEVMSVRVERAQDISELDAIAEGVLSCRDEHGRIRYKDYTADASGYGDPKVDYPTVGLPVTSFCTLWEKINGRESWESNPWVWVVEFTVLSTTGKPKEL